jgi:uncharacterized protein YdhG (YjbR/CyaY superfamily)
MAVSGIKAEIVWGSSYAPLDGNKITDYKPSDDIGKELYDYKSSFETTVEELNPFYREILDFVLARLGYPVIKVELTPFQVKTAIDEAVQRMSYHAPVWTKQYAIIKTTVGQNLYEIPQFIADNLTYVIYKKTLLSIQSQAGTLEFDYFIKYFQDAHLFSDFSVGEFYILQMHLEMVRKILSQDGSWDVLNNKILQLTPTPVVDDYCILEYRALDSNTIHPSYKSWIKRYSLACSKEILGQIRGKFKVLPGPGGGSQLNGDTLTQQAMQEKEKLIEELLSELEEPPIITTY